MKVFENEIIYDYTPDHLFPRIFTKYPNPYATHVQSVDTISRTVDPNTGIIRSERLLGVVQGAPRWITKLFSLPDTAYVREVIFIDPSEPKATMMSVNLSLAQYVSCLELIHYTPQPPSSVHPSSNEPGSVGPGAQAPATLFSQRALLQSGFPTALIARRIEKASLDRFTRNAGVGKQGFEWVLRGGEDARENERLVVQHQIRLLEAKNDRSI